MPAGTVVGGVRFFILPYGYSLFSCEEQVTAGDDLTLHSS